MTRAATLVRLALAALALAAAGCDQPTCPPDESFVVDEVGTCAPARTRFTLATTGCRLDLVAGSASSGLPTQGAMSQSPRPVRQGDFILYGDVSASGFRLCRARRVDFRLELSCVDGQGAPVCDATLTEPGP